MDDSNVETYFQSLQISPSFTVYIKVSRRTYLQVAVVTNPLPGALRKFGRCISLGVKR